MCHYRYSQNRQNLFFFFVLYIYIYNKITFYQKLIFILSSSLLQLKMINNLSQIEQKYGHYASFAVYANIDPSQKPKFAVGDTTPIYTFEKLHTNFIFVGLNMSGKGTIDRPFANFHNSKHTSNDYKIRYATQNTIFEGSYMTDIIKDYEEVMSKNVMKYVRHHPEILLENIETFKTELSDIGSNDPILIAFGNDAYKILSTFFGITHTIFKINHYSSYITKEQLRSQLSNIQRQLNNT